MLAIEGVFATPCALNQGGYCKWMCEWAAVFRGHSSISNHQIQQLSTTTSRFLPILPLPTSFKKKEGLKPMTAKLTEKLLCMLRAHIFIPSHQNRALTQKVNHLIYRYVKIAVGKSTIFLIICHRQIFQRGTEKLEMNQPPIWDLRHGNIFVS